MTASLEKKARRLLALLLLAISVVVIWVCMIQPALNYMNATAEERGIALRALRRNRALLREQAAIGEAQTTVAQSSRWRNFYTAPKAEAATLQMETDLRGIFRESNNPTSMIAEAATPRGAVTQIRVRVTLSMRIDQLAAALDRIQKHPRQLRVASLTIQAPEFQGSQVNPPLTIQAEITAMMINSSAERT